MFSFAWTWIKLGDQGAKRFEEMYSLVLLSVLLFYSCNFVLGDGKTLVLLDNLAIRETHSMFFNSLKGEKYLKCTLL